MGALRVKGYSGKCPPTRRVGGSLGILFFVSLWGTKVAVREIWSYGLFS